MNTLKKIFLLTLFSVFFLSAFSQFSNSTEILARIYIERSADPNVTIVDDRGLLDISVTGIEIDDYDDPLYEPGAGWSSTRFRVVNVVECNGCYTLTCWGEGRKKCKLRWIDMVKIVVVVRGLSEEAAETALSDVFTDSDEQVANGVYQGSVSKKLAIPGDKTNFIFFQMNWNYDPTNAHNGQAEIIISKTDNLGF